MSANRLESESKFRILTKYSIGKSAQYFKIDNTFNPVLICHKRLLFLYFAQQEQLFVNVRLSQE